MKLSTQKTKIPTKINNKIIFLFGPTAVGKTELLTDCFQNDFEVINADSMQVYNYLDIGSAKPSKELMDIIPHHLINILNPWEQFSVGQFIQKADEACGEIWAKGKIPVLTGGTAYYFKHFLYGLSSAPSSDERVRELIQKQIDENGPVWAYERVKEIDPISSERINPNDVYRLSRVLEVYEQTSRPLSSFSVPTVARNNMEPLIIGLTRDKDELVKRIELRVDIMLKDGLLDEIKRLINMGADMSWPGMQGIGYKEFFKAREIGECTLSSIASDIVKNSKQYAKRQVTFFKSFSNVCWVNPKNKEELNALLSSYLN